MIPLPIFQERRMTLSSVEGRYEILTPPCHPPDQWQPFQVCLASFFLPDSPTTSFLLTLLPLASNTHKSPFLKINSVALPLLQDDKKNITPATYVILHCIAQTGGINFNHVSHSAQYSQNIIISMCNHQKMINEIFHVLFHSKSEIQCEFYIYSTCQLSRAVFPLLGSLMWSVAVMLKMIFRQTYLMATRILFRCGVSESFFYYPFVLLALLRDTFFSLSLSYTFLLLGTS